MNERPVYSERASHRGGTPPLNNDQRHQVLARGSPRHGLQDMLVRSIEIASSDAHGVYQQDSHARFVAERPRQSLDHEIIVIPDDSPHHKRRRVLQGDDFGRSHLISTSSTHSRDFFPHQSNLPAPAGQGLFRNETVPDHLLPVYDAPRNSAYFRQSPGYVGKGREIESGRDTNHVSRHIGAPISRGDRGVEMDIIRRPVSDVRIVEREHATDPRHRTTQVQQLPSPSFSAQQRASHSYGMGPDTAIADQAFVQNFSESRFNSVLPQSSYNNQAYHASENPQYGEQTSNRPYITQAYEQERSHFLYMGGPP